MPDRVLARLTALVLAGSIAWFLWLPLSDLFAYPQRVSVLPNLETDAAAYDAFAVAFAESWTRSALPSKHPPGWMVVLAGVYRVAGHSYVAGKLVSWTALAVTVVLCGWLARRVYGATAGWVAALLCASSPGLRGYVGTLQYEVLTAALFALFLVLAVRVADATSRRSILIRAITAGLGGAALVLTRETFVLVVPIAAVWVRSTSRRTPLAAAATLAAVTLIGVAAAPAIAWSAAQTLAYQRLILISEKGPKEFQLGNNPLANGTYNEPIVGMAEPAGFAFIRAFPLDAMRLVVRKGLYLFGVLRDGWNVPHPATVWVWRATTGAVPLSVITPIVSGGWLLVATIAGLGFWATAWARWWVLPATAAAILMAHMITLGSYRFAVPLLPVFYVIASGPIAAVAWGALAALRLKAVAVASAFLMMLAVAAQFRAWPLGVEYKAVNLDGIAVADAVDDISGTPARMADAKGGTRPAVLLTDTYFPRGSLTVSMRLRRSTLVPEGTPVGRLVLVPVDGRPACARDVAAVDVPVDRFVDISVDCRLERDGPATLAVFTLGAANLSIDAVRMTWH